MHAVGTPRWEASLAGTQRWQLQASFADAMCFRVNCNQAGWWQQSGSRTRDREVHYSKSQLTAPIGILQSDAPRLGFQVTLCFGYFSKLSTSHA